MSNNNILQYESKIWATADLLRGSGFKESEWPSFMMPFFALVMIESRLIRMLDDLKKEIGEKALAKIQKKDFIDMIRDKGQGYNVYIFEHQKTLKDICLNDKTFDVDFESYMKGFDGETKDLLGVDATEVKKFLNMRGVVTELKAKRVLFGFTKLWSQIDLKPFNNSEITTLEEHIKRKWADISAETAGEQYTPDDVIGLISEIIASKLDGEKKLLRIYDCTCGGGNLLFGVEDRIKEIFKGLTQTFGQDWNDALYALAKIESRFRPDSKIEHDNTLTNDKFYNDKFDVVVANPPYGVSWNGYKNDILNDKTQRFQFIPSVADGQLLFMQHLISKLNDSGTGVVVHNGSTLFSGDAGSAESNIRKWMLDIDIVEAIIQLPTDEFFNTGIYTYLWVLNKNKPKNRKDKLMLINASEKFKPLKKSKGSKRKEVDEESRLDIVKTLNKFKDNEYARVFDKEYFYFNKQAIMLTNIDEDGKTFEEKLPISIDKKSGEEKRASSLPLSPTKLSDGTREISEFEITKFDGRKYKSLFEYFENDIQPFISSLDYKEQPIVVECEESGKDNATQTVKYWFDSEKETLMKETKGKKEKLGCGKIVIKSSYKKASATASDKIEISVELTPDYQKDYEIIPYHKNETANQEAIEAFMKKYITKPFRYLENVVGVEVNFNKVFYKPEKLREVSEILKEIQSIDKELNKLEAELSL